MDKLLRRKFIKKMLATRKAEALTWLKGGSPTSFRNLGEMATTEESVAFVEHLYSLGAKNVLAVKIVEWEKGENSGDVLIELPKDRSPAVRSLRSRRDIRT
jgi:hypothetical protein